jgi:hypothetical protein
MSASAALTRYLATIDTVLDAGRQAQMRHDQFRSAHPLAETAQDLPPELAGLLALYRQIYDEHLATPIAIGSSPDSSRATAPRALASRHRL